MIHYLGIDAGGSNCRARLIDARGVVVGEGRSGPANARIGIEALYATLMETADTAIAEAGLSDEARGAIRAGMGIAGITRLGMREALEALDFGFAGGTISSRLTLDARKPLIATDAQIDLRSIQVARLVPASVAYDVS